MILSMRTARTLSTTDRASLTDGFVLPNHTELIRSVTAKLVGIWDRGANSPAPRNLTVAAARAKVMSGAADPMRFAVVITLGAIAEGKTFAQATAWMDELYAAVKLAAKLDVTAGILPFRQRFLRLWKRETMEQAEADVAAIAADENDAAALDRVILETDQHIAALIDFRDCARQRRAELLTGR